MRKSLSPVLLCNPSAQVHFTFAILLIQIANICVCTENLLSCKLSSIKLPPPIPICTHCVYSAQFFAHESSYTIEAHAKCLLANNLPLSRSARNAYKELLQAINSFAPFCSRQNKSRTLGFETDGGAVESSSPSICCGTRVQQNHCKLHARCRWQHLMILMMMDLNGCNAKELH